MSGVIRGHPMLVKVPRVCDDKLRATTKMAAVWRCHQAWNVTLLNNNGRARARSCIVIADTDFIGRFTQFYIGEFLMSSFVDFFGLQNNVLFLATIIVLCCTLIQISSAHRLVRSKNTQMCSFSNNSYLNSIAKQEF